jgi:serine/threonine protein kinase
MQRYRWPGNLRELRNVIGSALAVSTGAGSRDRRAPPQQRGARRQLQPDRAHRRGGMGEVWLARHQLLARPAAIKIIHEAALGVSESPSVARQRFAREAHVTAELQSPHTVQLYDFGITDAGSFYYVMERLRGVDLQRMVERHGPLPAERVVFLLKQACLSLSKPMPWDSCIATSSLETCSSAGSASSSTS